MRSRGSSAMPSCIRSISCRQVLISELRKQLHVKSRPPHTAQASPAAKWSRHKKAQKAHNSFSGFKIMRDQWNYAARHIDRSFDVARVREMPGDIYSTHVRLKSFRIIDRNFSNLSRFK